MKRGTAAAACAGIVAATLIISVTAVSLLGKSRAHRTQPLDANIGGKFNSARSPTAGTSTNTLPPRAGGFRPTVDAGGLSAKEQERLISSRIMELDEKFRNEPINKRWSAEQEAMIKAAMVGTPTDNYPVVMPQSFDEECRSSLCRISMIYPDEENAVQMQGKLTLGLSGDISRARSYFLPTKDGETQLVIFAGNGNAF